LLEQGAATYGTFDTTPTPAKNIVGGTRVCVGVFSSEFERLSERSTSLVL
jgi:hypothetical protein